MKLKLKRFWGTGSQKEIDGSIKISQNKQGIIFWQKPSLISLLFSILAFIFIFISVVSASAPILPAIWYKLNPGISRNMSQILARSVVTFGDLLDVSGRESADYYQPEIDPDLSQENLILIPKIGVKTRIVEEAGENYEKALEKGVWRVPDFGTAFVRKYPMILVAHRFGYLKWTAEYRKTNSFLNLPKLEEGDRVEIIWEQRKYVYEIYSGEESEQITDYQADLILYTCKYLESPIRIFRYARLLRI